MNARRIPGDSGVIGTSHLFGKAEDGSHLKGGLAPRPFGGHRQGAHNGVGREEEVLSWAVFHDVSVQVQGEVIVHLRGKLEMEVLHRRVGKGSVLCMGDGVIQHACCENQQKEWNEFHAAPENNRKTFLLHVPEQSEPVNPSSLAFASIIRCDVRRYIVKR